jgi:hypothetical protein
VSEYTVPITFKHISHARNWVKKWRGFCDGNDTLSSILDQVEASFPQPPVVGDRVTVTMFADKPHPRIVDGVLLEITRFYYVVGLPTSLIPSAFHKDDCQIVVTK